MNIKTLVKYAWEKLECEDEYIVRTSDYDDTDVDDNGSGVSRDEPTDDITDRLNDQVGRSKESVRQQLPNDSPKQAFPDRGRTLFDEARYLATMIC